MQYSIMQYNTVQYSTVQYSTVQYSTVQYSTVKYSTVEYSTKLKYNRAQSTGQSTIRLKLTENLFKKILYHRIFKEFVCVEVSKCTA